MIRPKTQMIRRKSQCQIVCLVLLVVGCMGNIVQALDGVDEFNKRLAEWKEIIVEVNLAKEEYLAAKTFEESVVFRENYENALKAGDKKIAELKLAAAKAYRETGLKQSEYYGFMINAMKLDIQQREDLTAALVAAEALNSKPITDASLAGMAGMTLFYHQKFDEAEKLLKYALNRNALNNDRTVIQLIPRLKIQWEKELKLREKDAKTTLPRAIFETTKGKFVIELFEDEAPNTVKNFVKLAESGFYDGLEFFMVQPYKFAASGSSTNQFTGSGYVLENEGKDPTKRRGNFRGTLSAVARGENQEHVDASLFILTFTPYPEGGTDNYCNFGRVISGMEIVDSLNRSVGKDQKPIENFEPDKILKVTIDNKRDHDYEPKVIRVE